MLFRRRSQPDFRERVKLYFWPRRNWARSTRYVFHRLRRLYAEPHAIALGCAVGVFVSFTPFLGLHLGAAAAIAWIARASILASIFGTLIGNPVTFPFIWVASYQLGNMVLGQDAIPHPIDLAGGVFQSSLEKLWPLIKPMTVGGVPMGVVAGTIAYYLVRKAAEAYKEKRRIIREMHQEQPVRADEKPERT